MKTNIWIDGNIHNESWTTTWVHPKTVFEPYPNPKNSPLGPQKDKNDPQIKSNSNVRIQGIIENESCSTTWLDPQTVFEPYIEPKNSPLGPQKVKNNHKIKSKSNCFGVYSYSATTFILFVSFNSDIWFWLNFLFQCGVQNLFWGPIM